MEGCKKLLGFLIKMFETARFWVQLLNAQKFERPKIASMSTLEMIAREVGVSAQTVSNVLNGKNKETWGSTARRAAKIREVAQRVGYQPNVMARAVATGKSRVIGLVMYPHQLNYSNEIENGILKEASLQGYTTKLMHLSHNATATQIAELAEQCVAAKLEGIVALVIEEKDMLRLQRQMGLVGCPLVFVGGIPPQNSLGVYSDVPLSVRLGVEHLVALEHRRIGLLCGPAGSLTQLHLEAFHAVMNEFGLPSSEANVALSHWSDADVIAAAANRLLDAPEPSTAIFAVSDVQALVTFATARRRGLRLPEDLSVLCYGEVPLLAYTDPPLTTIIQPSSRIGHLAIQSLIAHIQSDEPDAPLRPLLVKEDISLVARGSTTPPATS
ncbi:HTH-type transcriptional repressor CytR [Abditibacteriota bacterium]|nr:HTH-type transcriptional repressor CytR [Abditibacteriota bacterium]